MATNTYSFVDHAITIGHQAYQAYGLNGRGVGEISISYANDNTTHDVAADGRVMTTKIISNNGIASITMQQTSELNTFLLGLFNALYYPPTPTAFWNEISITIRNIYTQETVTLNGVSFQKRADKPFQAQAQMVTWNFMVMDINGSGSIIQGLAQKAQQVALNTVASIINK